MRRGRKRRLVNVLWHKGRVRHLVKGEERGRQLPAVVLAEIPRRRRVLVDALVRQAARRGVDELADKTVLMVRRRRYKWLCRDVWRRQVAEVAHEVVEEGAMFTKLRREGRRLLNVVVLVQVERSPKVLRGGQFTN